MQLIVQETRKSRLMLEKRHSGVL